MAYSIRYGSYQYGREKKKKSARGLLAMTAAFLIILALGINVFWLDGARLLRELILPFSDEQTVEAFREMVQQVGDGTRLTDAVTAFCREVIEGAAP